MYMTQSANHFKVIKETVAALIWGFISFLLWDMAGSRSHAAKLFFCGTITSLPIWSTPSLHSERRLGGEGWSEEGLVKRERGESNERRGGGGKGKTAYRKNISREFGKGSKAEPVQSEYRLWGNQKNSQPVCVVGACACVFMCAFMFALLAGRILLKQSTK